MDGVDAPRLTQTIHATDPLFEPCRVPGQLQVDHEAASQVKVQSLTAGVGGDENGMNCSSERLDDRPPCLTIEAAMEDRNAAEAAAQIERRIAVLSEDEDGFFDAAEQPGEDPYLRLAGCRRLRCLRDVAEQRLLRFNVGQPEVLRPFRRFVICAHLAVRVEGQP